MHVCVCTYVRVLTHVIINKPKVLYTKLDLSERKLNPFHAYVSVNAELKVNVVRYTVSEQTPFHPVKRRRFCKRVLF